jgi:hypothetical protein
MLGKADHPSVMARCRPDRTQPCKGHIVVLGLLLQILPAAQGLHPPHADNRLHSRARTICQASTLEQPTMLGELFRGLPKNLIPRGTGYRDDREIESRDGVMVQIERPSMNSRKISASVVVNRPVGDVWRILTDYNNLATHVPNLVASRVVDTPWLPRAPYALGSGRRLPSRPEASLRLYQEGAQKIMGFDFRASVTMDMSEVSAEA